MEPDSVDRSEGSKVKGRHLSSRSCSLWVVAPASNPIGHSGVHSPQPSLGLTRFPCADLAWLPHLTAPRCSSSPRSRLFLCLWLFHTLKCGPNIFLCHDKIQSYKYVVVIVVSPKALSFDDEDLLVGEPESWFLLALGCDPHTYSQLSKARPWEQEKTWTPPVAASKEGPRVTSLILSWCLQDHYKFSLQRHSDSDFPHRWATRLLNYWNSIVIFKLCSSSFSVKAHHLANLIKISIQFQ